MNKEKIKKFLEEVDENSFCLQDDSKSEMKRTFIQEAYNIIKQYKKEDIENVWIPSTLDSEEEESIDIGFFHCCSLLDINLIDYLVDLSFNPDIFKKQEKTENQDTNNIALYYTPLINSIMLGFDKITEHLSFYSNIDIYPLGIDSLYIAAADSIIPHVFEENDKEIIDSFMIFKKNFPLPLLKSTHYHVATSTISKCYDIETIKKLENQGLIFNPAIYNDIYLDSNLLNDIIERTNNFDNTKEKADYLIKKQIILGAKNKNIENEINFFSTMGIFNFERFKQFYKNYYFNITDSKSKKIIDSTYETAKKHRISRNKTNKIVLYLEEMQNKNNIENNIEKKEKRRKKTL